MPSAPESAPLPASLPGTTGARSSTAAPTVVRSTSQDARESDDDVRAGLADQILAAASAANVRDGRDLVQFTLNFLSKTPRAAPGAPAAAVSGVPIGIAGSEFPPDTMAFVARHWHGSMNHSTKTPLAALGSVFFEQRFQEGSMKVGDFLQGLTPQERNALWGGRTIDTELGGQRLDLKAAHPRRLLAVYPGSFNPPTRAHRAIAATVAAMPEVQALWMDLTTPYQLKMGIAEVASERRDMVEVVLRDISNAGCASLMKVMGTAGHTAAYFDTVRQCSGPAPSGVAWVIGSDVVLGMRGWKAKARALLDHVDMLIVFVRDDRPSLPNDHCHCSHTEGVAAGVALPNEAEISESLRRVELAAAECWELLEQLFDQPQSVLSSKGRVVFRTIPPEFQSTSSSRALKLLGRALRHVPSDVLGYIAEHPKLRRHYMFP
eukprot:INCI12356.1.p1 GENE.INCI12356.1~~INCI12356.1.p1  ORF type:complete len:434 (-),score=51.90 INCI12356.1:22-1323(-)